MRVGELDLQMIINEMAKIDVAPGTDPQDPRLVDLPLELRRYVPMLVKALQDAQVLLRAQREVIDSGQRLIDELST